MATWSPVGAAVTWVRFWTVWWAAVRDSCGWLVSTARTVAPADWPTGGGFADLVRWEEVGYAVARPAAVGVRQELVRVDAVLGGPFTGRAFDQGCRVDEGAVHVEQDGRAGEDHQSALAVASSAWARSLRTASAGSSAP